MNIQSAIKEALEKPIKEINRVEIVNAVENADPIYFGTTDNGALELYQEACPRVNLSISELLSDNWSVKIGNSSTEN